MKIAYLVNTYPSPSHSFIRREIRALERRGVEVHRFAMRGDRKALVDPADLAEHERTEHMLAVAAGGCRARRSRSSLGPRGRPSRRCGWRWRPAAVRSRALASPRLPGRGLPSSRGAAGALGIEHLHAHFGTNSTTVAMLAQALGGPTYSFTVHGPEEFDTPGRARRSARRCAAPPSPSRSARSAAASSAAGSTAEDWERIHVVHCGIEPVRFPPRPSRCPRAGCGSSRSGGFVEQKGQLLLIEALAQARGEAPRRCT